MSADAQWSQNAVSERVSRAFFCGKGWRGTGTPRKSQSGFQPCFVLNTSTSRPRLRAYSCTSRMWFSYLFF